MKVEVIMVEDNKTALEVINESLKKLNVAPINSLNQICVKFDIRGQGYWMTFNALAACVYSVLKNKGLLPYDENCNYIQKLEEDL